MKPQSKRFLKRIFSRNETYLLIVLLVLIFIVSMINPRFLSAENFFDVFRVYSFLGIFSVGFLIVLISGGIDISFTATATVAQYIMAVVLANNNDVPIIWVILLPLLIGTALGAINGLLIHFLNAPSIIITIANLNVYYGILQFISRGRWIYNFPDWFRSFPETVLIKFMNQDGTVYGLSVLTAIWIGVAVVGLVILRYAKLGRRIYALGGNLEGARRAGLNIFGLRFFAYSFLGFTAGIGGVVHAMITQTVAPNALVGQEFDVLAAVVLGGASIFGGSGSIWGILLGFGLVAVIKNALTIMKVPTYWHQVFIGLVLIISIGITATRTQVARLRERKIDVA